MELRNVLCLSDVGERPRASGGGQCSDGTVPRRQEPVQICYREIPIVFADSRKFAEEWACRFLAAALSGSSIQCRHTCVDDPTRVNMRRAPACASMDHDAPEWIDWLPALAG